MEGWVIILIVALVIIYAMAALTGVLLGIGKILVQLHQSQAERGFEEARAASERESRRRRIEATATETYREPRREGAR